MKEAVIVSAVRSAVGKGKKDGALANVHPTDLSACVMRAALDQAKVDAAAVEDIFWGCAMPEASQGLNVARLSSLRAGIPVEVPSATINRFCSSGLQSVALAAQEIMCGNADVVLAGGVEMMSQVPMSGYHTRLSPELTESYIGMGFTAERVAERWKVTREDQDRWAHESQQKAARAWSDKRFEAQVVPIPTMRVTWKGAKKERCDSSFERDELLRPETTLEGLAKLKPAFKVNGTVTAGNASPYSDGAAAVLLMSRERAKQLGAEPLARFITFAAAGVEPDVMGIAPIKAVPKALKRAGLSMKDVSLIEFNEAFAAQVVAVVRDLGMPEDRVNVNGGAIALGHPLGATGSKLTTQLVHELRRMIAKGRLVVAGAMAFADSSHPEDELFIINFNEHVRRALPDHAPFTSSRPLLRARLASLRAGGKTALHDAVIAALDHVEQASHQKHVIIVLSDGDDNASRHSRDEMYERAKQSDAIIYAVATNDPRFGGDGDPGVLRRLAEIGGGLAYFPRSEEDVIAAFTEVAENIRRGYSIGYVPTNTARDGSFRKVKVMVRAEGRRLTARCRDGYTAPRSTSSH